MPQNCTMLHPVVTLSLPCGRGDVAVFVETPATVCSITLRCFLHAGKGAAQAGVVNATCPNMLRTAVRPVTLPRRPTGIAWLHGNGVMPRQTAVPRAADTGPPVR